MAGKGTRLSKIAREFNVGISTIVDFLNKKGYEVDPNPNTKVTEEVYDILIEEYSADISVKKESDLLSLKNLREKKETISINDINQQKPSQVDVEEEVFIKDPTASAKIDLPDGEELEVKIVGKVDLDSVSGRGKKKTEVPEKTTEEPSREEAPDKGVTAKKESRPAEGKDEKEADADLKVVGKIDLETTIKKTTTAESKTTKDEHEEKAAKAGKPASVAEPAEDEIEEMAEKQEVEDENFIKTEIEKITGPSVVGKIELPVEDREKKAADKAALKKKRKRIKKDTERVDLGEKADKETADLSKTLKKPAVKKRKKPLKPEVNEEDVQKQVKETLARLTDRSKSKGAKYRREKREAASQKLQEQAIKLEEESNIIKVTEFVTVQELASLMDVPATEVIAKCMELGLFVSINQRLDAETLAVVSDEFNYKIEFISVEVQEAIAEDEDDPDELESRPPIVTVMGHVDHGKTKLLDYIRSANVVAGEAGGITQHIGAYSVSLDDGRQITFLDTPGHEAFTAMRARGAQATDIVIIVVAADDGVMPQTVEAINHAQAAGVPIVFAINKIDKPTANPEKIKEELANMNYLVEDWGGKYQSQEISAKNGINIDELLEKVLLEAELLELKANPHKAASGSVIESELDKGRGFVSTVLVENGALEVGDVVLAGSYYGHVKAMYNERGKKIDIAGPSTPALILGLNGAPQAGDRFNVMESDKEAKEIANKREQLQREQDQRTRKHITLDEIGRRIAIGNFQELNIIVKGDVDGSIEALSDSLIKLSTEEIQLNVIHKAVGQIKEADIMLAAASNAIILGFQVRPSLSARKLAEKEEIDIRLYSVIYDAIEEVKAAMEGMLSPDIREEITATVEIREIFKITRVGTVAGCMVKEGKINRNSRIRVIRDGIVVYTGELGSLKRFKEDVREVASGYECGLNIAGFNDIKVGDVVEAYQEVEVMKKL
ncbi:MAG: translation initiation factor IF-2 [Bacteroides sp. SM1_62]|nr:MAG: translation initiation factor IF-2 [Bacteroides sp. SM23_62]KPL25867.1 MAG: translation initiation factor IF-2 [Bacteroides sp. SM1_62]